MADPAPLLVNHPDVQVSIKMTTRLPHTYVVELGAIAHSEAAGLVDAVPADLGERQERLSMVTVALSRARQAFV